MRHRFRPGFALIVAAIVQAIAVPLGQGDYDPRTLLGLYATIAEQYRDGDADAASRLLALGPLRLKTLHELLGHAIARQPEWLAPETSPWTPTLLRAAALMHTEIALAASEAGDSTAFQQHVDAADRLLVLAERREPADDFRPRWHVAVGIHLMAAGDVESARAFLSESCRVFPARVRVRLACGLVIGLYASRLKTTPPEPASRTADWARAAIQHHNALRQLARERASLLDDAERHLKAALAADPSVEEVRLRLAHLHIERRRDPEAAPLLVPLAALQRPAPLVYLARLMLGGIRERQGLTDAAEALYRDASALLPEAPRARIALANLLHAAGDRAASSQIVERVVTMRLNPPDDPWTLYRAEFVATTHMTIEDLRQEVRK